MGAQIGISRTRSLVLSFIPAVLTLTVLWWLITSGEWKLFGIWTLDSTIGWSTGFGDLAFITATADCFSTGVTNLDSCDPYGRPYTPYGLIPGTFLSWFGLGFEHTGILGSLLALVWVALIFWLTYQVVRNWASSKTELALSVLALTLFGVSPTVMLAVERGTLDILVAAFAALGLIGFTTSSVIRQTGSTILLFLAVIIKYFAVGVFAPFFAPRKWSTIASIGAVATLVFMIVNLDNLRKASEIAETGELSTTRLSFSHFTGLVTILVSDPLAISAPVDQNLNSSAIRIVSLLMFLLLIICLTVALRHMFKVANSNTPQSSWLLIVGGTFALTIPYLIGSSYDYRLIVLIVPLTGFLLWLQTSPALPLRITLWVLISATILVVLTSASMIVNDSGFIVPKTLIVLGDAALATVLAFGVALFINGWLPRIKVVA